MKLARINDGGSHGGKITSASSNVLVNGRGVARQGDTYQCPIHGISTIQSNLNDKVLVNGKKVARVGSVCSCGATITTGSDNTEV